jgi:hypothetical protein
MPVTIHTALHSGRQWNGKPALDTNDLFSHSCPTESFRSERVIQSDFSQTPSPGNPVTPSTNGLVMAIWHSYSSHHHLALRPEDVWFAILTQLSFYINAHAETLYDVFVSHQGQKVLVVHDIGTIDSVDFGRLAQEMTQEMQKKIQDPNLREWVIPSFSTTTTCDKVVASVLFMGAMKKYFSYAMDLRCGIPSVTLLGDKSDWEDILDRAESISHWQLGDEPMIWSGLLKAVLRRFVRSFEDPTSPDVTSFWMKCVHEEANFSGPSYIGGWVAAFCFWDEGGGCLYPSDATRSGPRTGCSLDGVVFHKVDTTKIPNGFASVPVTVKDYLGDQRMTMVAGSIGIHAWSSGQVLDNSSRLPLAQAQGMAVTATGLDSIQPVTGWWMYEMDALKRARENEREAIEENMAKTDVLSLDYGSQSWYEYMALRKRLKALKKMDRIPVTAVD